MSDLISRQAAIDAIADYLSYTTYTSAISFLNTAALILAKVPSAQQGQRWIPTSKKLPKEKGMYLTTTMYGDVYCDYWNELNFDRTEYVVAWKPMPEPYKGEES